MAVGKNNVSVNITLHKRVMEVIDGIVLETNKKREKEIGAPLETRSTLIQKILLIFFQTNGIEGKENKEEC